jgi:hypothetical protein
MDIKKTLALSSLSIEELFFLFPVSCSSSSRSSFYLGSLSLPPMTKLIHLSFAPNILRVLYIPVPVPCRFFFASHCCLLWIYHPYDPYLRLLPDYSGSCAHKTCLIRYRWSCQPFLFFFPGLFRFFPSTEGTREREREKEKGQSMAGKMAEMGLSVPVPGGKKGL